MIPYNPAETLSSNDRQTRCAVVPATQHRSEAGLKWLRWGLRSCTWTSYQCLVVYSSCCQQTSVIRFFELPAAVGSHHSDRCEAFQVPQMPDAVAFICTNTGGPTVSLADTFLILIWLPEVSMALSAAASTRSAPTGPDDWRCVAQPVRTKYNNGWVLRASRSARAVHRLCGRTHTQ